MITLSDIAAIVANPGAPDAELRALVTVFADAQDEWRAVGTKLDEDPARWRAALSRLQSAQRAVAQWCVSHGPPPNARPVIEEAVDGIAAAWVAVEAKAFITMPEDRRETIESAMFGPIVRGFDVLVAWVRP